MRIGWMAAVALGAVALVLGAPTRTRGGTVASAGADSLEVTLAVWQARALGRHSTGLAAWVTTADGALRLDFTVTEHPDARTFRHGTSAGQTPDEWTVLMTRSGRGWTLVAGPEGSTLYGAWDREWESAPPGLAELVRSVAQACGADGTSGTRATLILGAGAAVAADGPVDVNKSLSDNDFRRGMVARGLGGGGPGERVTIEARAGAGEVRVHSSRRPGRLDVLARRRLTTVGSAAEVFLPWWPLGEVLPLTAAPESGTSGNGAR